MDVNKELKFFGKFKKNGGGGGGWGWVGGVRGVARWGGGSG